MCPCKWHIYRGAFLHDYTICCLQSLVSEESISDHEPASSSLLLMNTTSSYEHDELRQPQPGYEADHEFSSDECTGNKVCAVHPAAVLIGYVTGLARPSVCLSVCLSHCLAVPMGKQNKKAQLTQRERATAVHV